jgi:hypothetical protein
VSRRFRPTDAFVDESIRGRRYIMGCVLVEARHLAELRTTMDTLSVTTSRIHFNNETDTQRRRVLDAIAEMPIEAFAVSCEYELLTMQEATTTCALAALSATSSPMST